MELRSEEVGLVSCSCYRRGILKESMGSLCAALGFSPARGSKVLLKPNLVSAVRNTGLACTHPEFVAAAAEWFVDHGMRVEVGDSPAFGTAKGVMQACGITAALRGLPVRLVNFDSPCSVALASGIKVGVARAALECDHLVSLPKVKAHGQLYVTLAVKNYFGAVVGFRKPWIHARHGDVDNRFEALLVDLLALLPGGITLADGIIAMHVDGPVNGEPFPLHLLAAGLNPVAVDTALLVVLGLSPSASPVWRECDRRQLAGCSPDALSFPLLTPAEVAVRGFLGPERLRPVSFDPWRLFAGAVKRLCRRYTGAV